MSNLDLLTRYSEACKEREALSVVTAYARMNTSCKAREASKKRKEQRLQNVENGTFQCDILSVMLQSTQTSSPDDLIQKVLDNSKKSVRERLQHQNQLSLQLPSKLFELNQFEQGKRGDHWATRSTSTNAWKSRIPV